MSASAYSLSISVPEVGFELLQGEPVIGGLHGPSRHYHCPHCKSWLFTRAQAYDGVVNLCASMIDEHAWFAPFVEVCTSEGYAWAKTAAVHSCAEMPDAAAFAALVVAFAEAGARPR